VEKIVSVYFSFSFAFFHDFPLGHSGMFVGRNGVLHLSLYNVALFIEN